MTLTPTPPVPQIVVLTNWFCYIGLCTVEDGALIIRQAQNLRRWGTTQGLGQLANSGRTAKSQIDPVGTVRAPLSAVVHLIDCNPAAWPGIALPALTEAA